MWVTPTLYLIPSWALETWVTPTFVDSHDAYKYWAVGTGRGGREKNQPKNLSIMKMLQGSLRFRDVSRWVKSLPTEAWWSKFNGENPPKPGHNGVHLQSQNFYSKMGGGEQSVTGRSWAEKQEIPSQQSGKWELAPESWSADFHVSYGMCVYACLHMCVGAQVEQTYL